MYCFKCGASIPDTAASCPQCGAVTAAQGSTPPPVTTQPAPAWQNPPQARMYTGPQQTEGKALASLIFGILSVLCLGVFAGIPAVILGHMAKSNIAKSMGRLKGEGMALAGLIMGYISIVLIPVVLIIAAIAIPNLIRARIVANESAAASTVRRVATAQMTYTTTYSGYASSLRVLGPGESSVNCADSTKIDAQHACLIEGLLACPETWCIKGGYRFNMTGVCDDQGACKDFVVTAIPVTPGSTGRQSFCSTSDGIVRFIGGGRTAGGIAAPTVEECQSWPMIQ